MSDKKTKPWLKETLNINDEFLTKKGLCGLNNLGNTCFMNSIIQCLNNTIPLLKYFGSNEYKRDINEEKIERHIIEQWNLLTRQLWFKNSVVTPDDFHRTVQGISLKKGNHEFLGYHQNDSQEFLQFLLESLHNGLSREVIMRINGVPKNELDKLAVKALENWREYFKNDYSKIVEIFYGQFFTEVNTVKDSKEDTSLNFEPFNCLSLEVPVEKEYVTIYTCLDSFCNPEELNINENEVKTKTVYFWTLPNILIIFFKKWDKRGNKFDKRVEFPINDLDMTKYMRGYNRDTFKYDLYGVVNHVGGSMGGHYYSYVKNNDNNWYKYNDNVVSTLNEDRVVNENAYCLFYRKK